MQTLGYDCIIIPGATKKTPADALTPGGSEFCGRALVTADKADQDPATVCSKLTPFSIRFLSDNYEFGDGSMGDSKNAPKGFKLDYKQSTC